MLEEYIVLAIAFALGILVGYLIGKEKYGFKSIRSSTSTDISFNEKKFQINPVFNKNASLDYKPMVLSSSNLKNDLKKIKGIDEDLEKKLYELGIFTFNQIASWSSKNCEWIENFINLPNYARQNHWVEQAKILKTGRETEYSQALLDEENAPKEEDKEIKEDKTEEKLDKE